jgi:FixJ family two-component response regulator
VRVRLPIVVVSAAGELPESSEERGVRAFFRKPFDMEELADCIARTATVPATLA